MINLLTHLATGAISFFGQKAINGAKAVATQTATSGSLLRATEPARVEPITIVDHTLEHNENLEPVLNVSLNLFTAVYVQALALQNVTVSGVHIINRLGALNPSRTSAGAMDFASSRFAAESFDHQGDLSVAGAVYPIEMEEAAYAQGLPSVEHFAALEAVSANTDARSGMRAEKGLDTLRDSAPLAVGKLINVQLREGTETYDIPVSVRLATTIASSHTLIKAMASRFKGNETALERKYALKSGRASSILEMMLCTDLVRDHAKNLMSDSDGLYSKLTPQKSDSVAAAAVTGQASIASASNILVVSRETLDQVEVQLGIRFKDFQARKRMFEATGIMLIAVMETDWNAVTFYYDGIAQSNTVSASALKNSSKKDGPDIGEVLKSIVNGGVAKIG